MPLGYGKLFKEKTVNWMYQTEPEPGLNGRQVFQPRGKVLGGSSSINGLLYVRGQHEDYDRWRQRGNAGWGFDDVLPYFKKAENQQRGADQYHGSRRPAAGVGLAARRSAVGGFRRRPRSRPAFPTIRISTAPRRKAPAFSRPRRAAAAAPAPRVSYLRPAQAPRQSAGRDRRAGAAHRVRGTPRDARRIQAGRQLRTRAGAQGNPGVERRLQLAAAAAALRRRSRRSA